MSPSKRFFFFFFFLFLKMEGDTSEHSLELCLSQTGLAKDEKLHQTTSS